MHSQALVARVRGVAFENGFFRALWKMKCAMQTRWLALVFTRRFYRQARDGQALAAAAAPAPDLGETLIVRSLAPRLHALVQLRVASRIASIAETERCLEACRATGWSGEQIGATLLATLNGSFSEAERLLLRYADDLTRTPIDVDRQVVRQLRAHLTPAELLELTASIAYENFRVRYREAAAKLD